MQCGGDVVAGVQGGVLLCEHHMQLVRFDMNFVNAYLKSGRFGNELGGELIGVEAFLGEGELILEEFEGGLFGGEGVVSFLDLLG